MRMSLKSAAMVIAAAGVATVAVLSGTASASSLTTRVAVESFTLTSHGSNVFSATAEGNLFFGDGTVTQLSAGPDPAFRADIANGTFIVATFGGQESQTSSEKDCTTRIAVVNILYTVYQGTGALQGLRGAGNAVVHATITGSGKPGRCQFTRVVPNGDVVVITATGPLTLPLLKSSRWVN